MRTGNQAIPSYGQPEDEYLILSPPPSPSQVGYRLETLRHHVTEIQRQKQTVHEYLFSNNESIGRIQAEVNMACNSNTGEQIEDAGDTGDIVHVIRTP